MRTKNPIIFSLVLLASTVCLAQQRLLVVGGGERPPAAMKHFVEWSGGAKARILFIPWATAVPDESFAAFRKSLEPFTYGDLEMAATYPFDAGKRAAFLAQLQRATGVFFSGGDQNRIMDVLTDEELLSIIRDKYRSGTPFGGTSAGAAVMSDPMITGDADLKIIDGTRVGVRKGLGLVPGVVFDQHFLVRQRHNRLIGLMLVHPALLGIGIDEDTAVSIEDGRWLTVLGKTYAMFIHSKNRKQPFLVSFLRAGERFDLRRRQQIGKK